MNDESPGLVVPRIPGYLLDPRPVVIIGTLAWAFALLATMLVVEVNTRTVTLCAVGVGVGALGSAVYALQRRAVLRGSAGAQNGLDVGLDSGADQGLGAD